MSTIPAWIKNNQVDCTEVTHNGKTYQVFILSRDIEPALPGFMGFLQEMNILIISEDVPEKWRPYVLRHELREFTELCDHDDRCVRSLQAELDEVSPDERSVYLRWRLDFFKGLVSFYEEKGHHDPNFIPSITASRDYLQTLVGRG